MSTHASSQRTEVPHFYPSYASVQVNPASVLAVILNLSSSPHPLDSRKVALDPQIVGKALSNLISHLYKELSKRQQPPLLAQLPTTSNVRSELKNHTVEEDLEKYQDVYIRSCSYDNRWDDKSEDYDNESKEKECNHKLKSLREEDEYESATEDAHMDVFLHPEWRNMSSDNEDDFDHQYSSGLATDSEDNSDGSCSSDSSTAVDAKFNDYQSQLANCYNKIALDTASSSEEFSESEPQKNVGVRADGQSSLELQYPESQSYASPSIHQDAASSYGKYLARRNSPLQIIHIPSFSGGNINITSQGYHTVTPTFVNYVASSGYFSDDSDECEDLGELAYPSIESLRLLESFGDDSAHSYHKRLLARWRNERLDEAARNVLLNSPTLRPILGRAREAPNFSFIPVKRLPSGNGISTLEVVRSCADRNAHGYGLACGSLWVLKSYYLIPNVGKVPTAAENRRDLKTVQQLSTEVDCYIRIAEAPDRESYIGFSFLMEAVGTMTFADQRCIIMPLAKIDLRTHINDGEFTSDDIRRLIAQIALGLNALHIIGIIHSDLKPENILLDYKGNVKLVDYGLSYATYDASPLEVGRQYTSELVGTRGYIAPEKKKGMYGLEVDYWALGCISYELLNASAHFALTGRTQNIPFENDRWNVFWQLCSSDDGKLNGLFKRNRPDPPACNLILGLLDTNPRTRLGIQDLVVHDYFLRADDTSEFAHIHEAFSRYEEEVEQYQPIGMGYIADPFSQVKSATYCWINRNGGWFSQTHSTLIE